MSSPPRLRNWKSFRNWTWNVLLSGRMIISRGPCLGTRNIFVTLTCAKCDSFTLSPGHTNWITRSDLHSPDTRITGISLLCPNSQNMKVRKSRQWDHCPETGLYGVITGILTHSPIWGELFFKYWDVHFLLHNKYTVADSLLNVRTIMIEEPRAEKK